MHFHFSLCWLVGLLLLLSSCSSVTQDCYLFERGTHEFRECRANEGAKEYQYRMGVQEMLLGNHKASRSWLKKAVREFPEEKLVRNRGVGGINDTSFMMRTANAQDGHDAASFILAKIYQEGIGVSVDLERAGLYLNNARTVTVEIEELKEYFNIKTYRVTSRDEDKTIIERFELGNFKVIKNDE